MKKIIGAILVVCVALVGCNSDVNVHKEMVLHKDGKFLVRYTFTEPADTYGINNNVFVNGDNYKPVLTHALNGRSMPLGGGKTLVCGLDNKVTMTVSNQDDGMSVIPQDGVTCTYNAILRNNNGTK